MDAVFEQPVETDKYWVDDKQRTTEVLQADKLWMEARQSDQHAEKHVERQRFENRLQERTFGEPRTTDRQSDKYWTESRHPDRHVDRQWTVDRHTQRQIDRKIERQWMGGRQIDRSWSENRPADIQVDSQWSESRQVSRKTERQVQALHLAQRPLPPYPSSDRTPSPKQETDSLKSPEAAAADWHQQEMQGDAGGGFTEGWRSSGGGGGGGGGRASKPDPPPQSSKPNLSKLRQRHRLESSDTLPGNSPPSRFMCCRSERRSQVTVTSFYPQVQKKRWRWRRMLQRWKRKRERKEETLRVNLHRSQKRCVNLKPCMIQFVLNKIYNIHNSLTFEVDPVQICKVKSLSLLHLCFPLSQRRRRM